MAVLAVATPSITPATTTLVAASAGGDSFPNSGAERFRVRNESVASITVTIAAVKAVGCPAGTLHNITMVVLTGTEQCIRNLDPARFNDANGRVAVTYSGVTTLFVGVEA